MQPHIYRYDWSFGMRKNERTETDTQGREEKKEKKENDDADVKKEKREYEEKKKCSRKLSSLLVDKRRQIINNAPVYVYFMRGRPRILIGFVGIFAVVILVELFFSSEAQKPGEYQQPCE